MTRTNPVTMITNSSWASQTLPHQENMRVVFGHLWGLWKDLKISKALRPHIFRETGTNSFRDPVICARLLRTFQRALQRWSLALHDIFTRLLLYPRCTKNCVWTVDNYDIRDINHLGGGVWYTLASILPLMIPQGSWTQEKHSYMVFEFYKFPKGQEQTFSS